MINQLAPRTDGMKKWEAEALSTNLTMLLFIVDMVFPCGCNYMQPAIEKLIELKNCMGEG